MMLARILSLLTLGRVTLADDSGNLQILQITRKATGTGGVDAIVDQVPRLGEFGFTSVPPIDADVVVANLAGRLGNGVAIATGHKASRPKGLKPGDTAIYDVRGRIIRLTEDGIEIDAAGAAVVVTNASRVRCTCDIETTGDVLSRADGKRVSLNALHDTFNLHNHPPVAAGASWGSGPPKPQA